MKILPAKRKPLDIQVLIKFMNEWLSRSSHYYNGKSDKQTIYIDTVKGKIKVKLYTHDNVYDIVATTTGYLGAGCSSRRPEPGESWTRGRDFPDGTFNEMTWNKIISAIA